MEPRGSVAGRSELVERGFSEAAIDGWIRSGRLVPVLHGVYSFGRDVDTREATWRAALALAGPAAVLTGHSACEAWGIIEAGEAIPERIEVGVPSGQRREIKGRSPALRNTTVEIVRRDFEPGEVVFRDGLAAARPARALTDLAAGASERDLMFAFLEACRLRLFGRPDLDYCLRRIVGRRGARNLRSLLARWVPELGRIRSVLEGMFVLALVEGRLPMPLVNAKVCGYEVDCHWPAQALVVELDGNAFHSDPLARTRDSEKTRRLEANGLKVLRISYSEMEQDPAAVIAQVRSELRKVSDYH